MKRLQLIISVVFLVCVFSVTALAATYNVYPADTRVNGRNNLYGFSEWRVTPQPGDVFLLYDNKGPYKEHLLVHGFKGTSTRPIVIKAAPGHKPVIEGTVSFIQSQYVVLEGVIVTGTPYAGIGIRQGSSNITVKNNLVYETPIGVWIAENAGMQNLITENTLYLNHIFGIAVDRVNCLPGMETVISNNKVIANGSHGIEINASYYIIEGNEVFENGHAMIGTSGIHVIGHEEDWWIGGDEQFYAPTSEFGNYNIIRRNIVFNNREALGGPDGNGIQLDTWSENNRVYGNIVFGNDGPGLSLFDANGSVIYDNVIFDNAQNIKNSHFLHKAEISISTHYNGSYSFNLVREATLFNNVFAASAAGVPALFIDAPTSANDLNIEANMFFHKLGSDFFFWKDAYGNDIDVLNTLPGFSQNHYGDPSQH